MNRLVGGVVRSTVSVVVMPFFLAIGSEARQATSFRVTEPELAPGVKHILESGGPQARLASNYLKYAKALLIGGDALDEYVDVDVKLHDLETLGFKGLTGLKEFRKERNASFLYDRSVVSAMRFPEADIIEVDLCTERTDTASGAKRIIVVAARNRWRSDRLVERWDRVQELPAGSDCGAPLAK